MNTSFKKTIRIVVALALTTTAAITTASATQQSDQVAIQLGAIQLGITNLATATPLQQAQALTQGRQVLASTATKAQPVVAGQSFTTNQVQTSTLQDQIYAATQAALTNPVNILITPSQKVALNNGKSVTVANKTAVNPKKTTASAIILYSLPTIPNYGPSLVQTAVSSAFAGGTNPVFGYTGSTTQKLEAAQLTDAGKAASAALSYSLKAYKTGTKNWAGVPKTGTVTNAVYLPNLGTTPFPSTTVSNQQLPTPTLITKFASAIAANAINGLGEISGGAAGTYGKTQANVQSLTTALVKGAVAFQKTSISQDTGQRTVGAIGASVLGIVSQVSGDQNETFGTADQNNLFNKAVLQGVVTGAVSAGKTYAWAVAIGIAQGFTGTYLETTYSASGTPVSNATFLADNAAAIVTALQSANGGKVFTAAQLGTYATTGLLSAVTAGINAMYTAFDVADGGANPTFQNITGSAGIKNFGLVNGIGTPVTDTVGL